MNTQAKLEALLKEPLFGGQKEILTEVQAKLEQQRLTLQAVLFYYTAQPWGQEEMDLWKSWTGEDVASTKSLCDAIRRVLG